MKNEVIAKAEALIAEKTGAENAGYCALATIDEKGFPTISTISVSKADGIRWLTFGSALDSDRVKRIKKCNYGCVCFNSAEYHISLVGTIEVLSDPQAKQDSWYEGLEYHFSGADDPNFCVLRFTTERYNLFFIDDESADAGLLPKE